MMKPKDILSFIQSKKKIELGQFEENITPIRTLISSYDLNKIKSII